MGDMIRLSNMQVRFWGTRGSIAAPGASTARYGGNTSCVEVRASDGTVIVLDCGTGARELGLHLAQTLPQPIRLDVREQQSQQRNSRTDRNRPERGANQPEAEHRNRIAYGCPPTCPSRSRSSRALSHAEGRGAAPAGRAWSAVSDRPR